MNRTVQIDAELLRRLEQQASAGNLSVAELLDQILRQSLGEPPPARPVPPFRQAAYPMGPPKCDVTKALSLAADLEDEETIRKMAAGK